ncbi:GNAT family N-acetyltransferase [Gudongella sp. SC589]|uniref:GNAT family N-acetyltransferase n=1 Tax=Gudongella sp. SC589 TaxID=3385990 RepID=UPI003904ACC7
MYNLHLWNSPEWGRSGELVISVYNEVYNRGEALDELWRRAEREIETNMLEFVMASHDTKDHDLEQLFSKNYFREWFCVIGMVYSGDRMADSGLESRLYIKDDFDAYHRAMGDAFETMRKEIDVRPHNIFENRSPERMEILQKQMENLVENTYLFFQDGTWVGSAMIKGNEIDEVFVVPSQKGRGYGRKILNDCVNRVLEKGNGEVFLKVVDWNKTAMDLYKQSGFREYVKMRYLRKIIKEQS